MTTAVIGIGGLGHMAVQFLHKLGHEVTGFTTSPDKEAFIKELGADHVVVSTDQAQMDKVANSFDLIINTIPSKSDISKFIHTLAPFGYFVQVGLPAVTDASSVPVPLFEMVMMEKHVVGSLVGPIAPTEKMLDLCVEKNIYPIVEEFSFEDFPKAFEKLEHGKPHFRCVVNVKDFAEKNGWKK